MNDHSHRDPLVSTLRTWRHEPAASPEFNEKVWARIRSSESVATARTASIIPFPTAFPLAASVAVLLSIAAGTGSAFALNRTLSTERMAAAYVRSIDPVQITGGDSHASHNHP